MGDKLKRLKEILKENPAPAQQRSKLLSRRKNDHVVGVLSWSERRESEWLHSRLASDKFKNHVKEIENINLSKLQRGDSLRDAVSRCTFFILYISGRKWGDVPDSGALEIMSEFEKHKVTAVIGGLDDRSMRGKDSYILRHAGHLLVFNEDEMSPRAKGSRSQKTAALPIEDTASRGPRENHESASEERSRDRNRGKRKVGIFSRSSEEDYAWLRSLLRSEEFRDRVKEVRPCYISNNGGPQFRDDVSRCSFAILYHTKNRGRINVTDVEDALYNTELAYLSRTLGKANVAVVIDDLEDSGEAEKRRILGAQMSIGRFARDLFIFSQTEKDPGGGIRRGPAAEKIRMMKKMLK